MTSELHLTPSTPTSALSPVLDELIGPHHGGYERGVGVGPHRQERRRHMIHDIHFGRVPEDPSSQSARQFAELATHVQQVERMMREGDERRAAEAQAERARLEADRARIEAENLAERARLEEERVRLEEDKARMEADRREDRERERRLEEYMRILTSLPGAGDLGGAGRRPGR